MMVLFQWFISAVALLWMICLPGLGVVRLAERTTHTRRLPWHLAWIAGVAATAPLLYLAGRFLPFSGTICVLACTLAGLILLAIARGRGGRIHLPPAPGVSRCVLVVVLAISAALAASHAEILTGSDIYTTTVRDWNGRQAVIWSVRQFGLPLQDSLFYPGKSVGMYYPAGAYLAVAAASDLGGNNVPDAWPYAIFIAMTFASLCLLAADLAGRMFSSRRAANWAAAMVCMGGLDVFVNLGLKLTGKAISLGHVGAWADPTQLRIDAPLTCALWAAPHLAAAAGCFVVIRWLPLDIRRRGGGVLAAGLVLAGMFYLSAYATLASAAVIAVAMAAEGLRRRRRRWLGQMASLCLVGAIAVALATVWLFDLRAADMSGGRSKLEFHLPAASIHPVSWMIGGLGGKVGDMAIQFALELLPLVAFALAGWLSCKPAFRWSRQRTICAVSLPVIAACVLLVRSTGQINDWGVRATHILQIAAAVLAAGWLAGASAWPRAKRILVYGLVLAGFSATAWQVGSSNLGRLVVTTPAHRFELHQAARYIKNHTPADAVVMISPNIDGIDYARRWSDRRSLLANTIHGSMAYADPVAMKTISDACQEAVEEGFAPSQARTLRNLGATVSLATVEQAAAAPPEMVLYRNKTFAVVSLGEDER